MGNSKTKSKWLRSPAGYSQMDLLQLCVGYHCQKDDGKWTVLVQEHRSVVPVIWAALQDRLFSKAPILFRLDAHTDLAPENHDYKKVRKNLKSIEDALLFANGLSADDGGWAEPVVQMGWIKDMACLYVQDEAEGDWTVIDLDKTRHEIIVAPGVAKRFATAITKEARERSKADAVLVDLYDLALRNSYSKNDNDDPPSIWFDIDLDFATMDVKRRATIPWPLDRFHLEFGVPIVEDGLTVGDLLRSLLELAKLVTIATEPEFCGGFAGPASILSSLSHTLSPDHFSWFESPI